VERYQQEYNRKLVTPEKAAQFVKTGDIVDYGQMGIKPIAFDKALAARKNDPDFKNVIVRVCNAIPPVPEILLKDPAQRTFTYYSVFLGLIDRAAYRQGICGFIPGNYHQVADMPAMLPDIKGDIWCGQVSPMNENGFFSFGITNSHNYAWGKCARARIVEITPDMPRALGGYHEGFHISEVDAIIETNNSLPCLPPMPEGSPEVKRIAEYIVDEIHDGCCIQLGIGGVPNEIGNMIAASNIRNLSIHSEFFNDAMMRMHLNGQITNAGKPFDKGKSAYTFSFGSRECYDFIHNNQLLASYPANYTNDPFRIASIDNMVSINKILEVDLFSQVCSESIGTRQFSGTGGHVDFVSGALESKGGKAFLAFTSTYRDKQGNLQSRIKPVLTPGAIVTVPRTITPWLVTEYGKVNMFGLSIWKRAEALIGLAHPDFREDLIKEAEKMNIWRPSSRL
jgi:acyl-CoA hydrolase